MTVRALEWDEHGRDRSFLLRGTELADAEQWLAAGVDKVSGPTALEQEYLLAARQAASRRQRILVGGSLAVAVVAVGLLIFALISRSTAVTAETNARAQALAAESVNQQSVDAERAVLLGAAAVRTRVSYGATGTMFALRSAIDASTIRYRLPDVGVQGCGGPEVAFDPAPQSNLLAEGLCNGTIRFADATTGGIERTVRAGRAAPNALAYTASGSALVTTSGAHILMLDPVTGAVRATSPPIPGLGTFAIDPRAPIVAAVGVYQLDLWNMATGRVQVIRPRQARRYGPPTQMAFSPDGRRIAIGFDAGNGGPGLVIYDLVHRRISGSRSALSSTVSLLTVRARARGRSDRRRGGFVRHPRRRHAEASTSVPGHPEPGRRAHGRRVQPRRNRARLRLCRWHRGACGRGVRPDDPDLLGRHRRRRGRELPPRRTGRRHRFRGRHGAGMARRGTRAERRPLRRVPRRPRSLTPAASSRSAPRVPGPDRRWWPSAGATMDARRPLRSCCRGPPPTSTRSSLDQVGDWPPRSSRPIPTPHAGGCSSGTCRNDAWGGPCRSPWPRGASRS